VKWKEVSAMLTEPLSVTYNGSAKSLAKVSASSNRTVYRTGDSEFEVTILKAPKSRDGRARVDISLARILPDPTPTDVFDPYRDVRNVFTIAYGFDLTKASASVDLPRLRTALLAFVDSTLEGRLLGGEM
jgi:hypothetical protein